jgi:hypothetical protein
MIFKEELAKKILQGEKTATRRVMSDNRRSPWYREQCAYKVGQVFTINPGRGVKNVGSARVTGVYKQAPLYVSGEQARQEGFGSSKAFHETFRAINPGADLTEAVWVIEFELVQP